MKIANAPTSWGVEDAKSPDNPPWKQVLSEIAAAGYKGTELGPYGYMPTQAGELAQALAATGLSLVAGTLLDLFHNKDSARELEARGRAICRVLRENDAPHLVAISAISTNRVDTAGQSDVAARLGTAEWTRACDTLNRIGEVAASEGVALTVHSHAGTHIEFIDELERILEGTDPSLVGLCVDTGHAAYAGIDPAELVTAHADRVRYIHLKDVDPAVRSQAITRGMGFWEAYAAGVFCPVGEGMVDFSSLFSALERNGYGGWYTVEQDAPPTQGGEAWMRAKRSLRYIQGLFSS